jgi:acetoin utilization deacetylase AcuC-like enzyme
MIIVFSQDHRSHFGKSELYDGKLITPFECPERMDRIIRQIEQTNLGQVIAPQDFGIDPVLRVHSKEFVDFLQTAFSDWERRHGDCDAMPNCWPSRTLRQKQPKEIEGRLGYYSFDSTTPITAGTWKAATASANVALTGAELICSGNQIVFSACRPPGHHAGFDTYGGFCFLNNAAIAVQFLLDHGAKRVALLDVDYHHGNGSQTIFYDRADVIYVSLHCDPGQDYPFFLGYTDETGSGKGRGFNCNLPMPWGTRWKEYREKLFQGLKQIRNYSPDAMVISLGVDIYEKDPISKFKLKSEDFTRLGEIIAKAIHCPNLFIMEGGYAVEDIGINVCKTLTGFLNA